MLFKNNKIIIIRIFSLCILAILLFINYGVARNAIDSLFLEKLSSEKLPIAWLLTGLTAIIVMSIYNRYNIKNSLLNLFSISSSICGLILTILLIFLYLEIPGIPYCLYIWKEVHIVLLVEIFWSFSDIVFSIKIAKWLYGVFMFMGSLGSIIGNIIVSFISVNIGTIASLWMLVPIFIICYIVSFLASFYAGDKVPINNKMINSHISQNLILIQNSKYLFPLLCIVLLAQMSITFIDYEYNTLMQLMYPNLDIRTSMMGKIHAILDSFSIFFQLSCGIILRLLGVGRTIISIPFIVGILSLIFLIIPNLILIITVRIGAKCLDYSIFKAVKEILYIPLTHAEKTQGKALIDIMIYRIGKALSSIMLLGMFSIGLTKYTMSLAFLFQFMWLILALNVAKRYKQVKN